MVVQDLQIDKNIAGIYKFVFPNGKTYIGKSINIYKRFTVHKSDILKKDTLLYRAFRKYGWDNVIKEIIEYYIVDEYTNIENLDNYLLNLEIEYISLYNSRNHNYGYNCTIGGEGTVGHHVSILTRKKISNAHIGMKASEETKRKMSTTRTGMKHTPETILKMKRVKRTPSDNTLLILKQCNKNREIAIKVFKDNKFIAIFESISSAAKFINSCKSDICKCLKGKIKKVKGFNFEYVHIREKEKINCEK